MRRSMLLGLLVSGWVFSQAQAVPIPVGTRLGSSVTLPGTYVSGQYYDRTPANATDVLTFAGSNAPNGTFRATTIRYGSEDPLGGGGNMTGFLGAVDGATLTAGGGHDRDSISLILNGVINIRASDDIDGGTAGIQVGFWSGSDDGSRITIGGVNVVNNDAFQGYPGGAAGPGTADFATEGQYPFQAVFYEGGGGDGWRIGTTLLTGIQTGANSQPAGYGTIAPNRLDGVGIFFNQFAETPVAPEPGSIALFGSAALLGGVFWWKKMRRA